MMKKYPLLLLLSLLIINHCAGKLFVSTDDIKVRKNKGAHVGQLGVIKKGTIVDVAEMDGEWGVVEFQGKDGYIKTKSLREAAQPTQAATQEANNSTGLIPILLFAGGILFVTLLVKRFAHVGTFGTYKKTRPMATSKKASLIPTYWYQCKNCRAIVKKGDHPSHNGCLGSKQHHWTQMAEVGIEKYMCKECMAIIQSTAMPTTEGCPGGGYHVWAQRASTVAS